MTSKTFDITVNGSHITARESGAGETIVLLYGYGGVPRLSRFEEELAKSHRVVTIPLPGQQGSDRGHDKLHTPLDWVTAALDAIETAVGVDTRVHIVAQSVAGMLAGEIAAISPHWLRSVTLIGPLGLYQDDAPPRNLFAEAPPNRVPFMTRRPELFRETYGAPDGLSADDKHEYEVLAYRADEATARLMWPFGDIGLKRRMHRVKVPVQLIWGEGDQLVPPAYADKYAEGLNAPVKSELIPDCGHLVVLEAPEACAGLIKAFVEETA